MTQVSNKKKILAICLLCLVLAQFILFVTTFSGMLPTVNVTTFLVVRTFIGSMALGTIVDTVLALSIVIFLRRHRSKIPFAGTGAMIDRIMMYTVGSGLLTAAFALAALITMLRGQFSFIWLALLEMLPKRESICYSVLVH